MPSPTGGAVIAAEWILLTASALMILARLYLRLKINRQRLLIGDVFICLAWCSAVATVSFDIVFHRMNVLRPDVDAFLTGYHGDEKSVQRALKYFWASNIPFFTSFYLSKATLLAFYWQIIPEFMTTSRYFLYGTTIYCALGYLSSMLLNLFLCFPIHRNWALGKDACYGPQGIVFQTAWAFNFSADVLIFIVPFSFLHILKVKGAVRVGVYCIFGLGLVNMAFSLTRLLSIKLAPHNAKGTVPITLIILWSTLDMTIGVLIANLPSLRPYLRMIRARPCEPAPPQTCNREAARKNNTLDKYNCGPLDEETMGSTPQNSVWKSENGRRSLKDELEDAGIIASNGSGRSGEPGNDMELCDAGAALSLSK